MLWGYQWRYYTVEWKYTNTRRVLRALWTAQLHQPHVTCRRKRIPTSLQAAHTITDYNRCTWVLHHVDVQPMLHNKPICKLSLYTFNVDLIIWSTFKDSFSSAVQRLHTRSSNCCNANYQQAIILLQQRYGRKQKITTAFMSYPQWRDLQNMCFVNIDTAGTVFR